MTTPALGRRASALLHDFLVSNRPRGKILVPANVCPIVPFVLLKAKTPFELVDISTDDLGIDQGLVSKRLERGDIGGLIYVRPYGRISPQVDPFFSGLRETTPELLIIDDRCLSRPSLAKCPDADLTLYSTGYGKYVDLGEGAYGFLRADLTFSPTSLAGHAAAGKSFPALGGRSIFADELRADYESDWLNTTVPSRAWPELASSIQAALAKADAHKVRLNSVYETHIPAYVRRAGADFNSWRYQILLDSESEKKAILEAVFAAGLFASTHYGVLAPELADRFPVAADLSKKVINLFNDHHFSMENALRICEIIRQFLADN